MSELMGSGWVIAKQLGGRIPLVSFQMVAKARKFAKRLQANIIT